MSMCSSALLTKLYPTCFLKILEQSKIYIRRRSSSGRIGSYEQMTKRTPREFLENPERTPTFFHVIPCETVYSFSPTLPLAEGERVACQIDENIGLVHRCEAMYNTNNQGNPECSLVGFWVGRTFKPQHGCMHGFSFNC